MITFVRLQFKRLLSLSYEEYCLSGFELHFSTRESSIFQLKKQAGWKALQPCEVAISLYYRFLSDNVGVPSKYINFLHHYVSHKHTHTILRYLGGPISITLSLWICQHCATKPAGFSPVSKPQLCKLRCFKYLCRGKKVLAKTSAFSANRKSVKNVKAFFFGEGREG